MACDKMESLYAGPRSAYRDWGKMRFKRIAKTDSEILRQGFTVSFATGDDT
jgi:hypothetical protein